MDAYVDEHQLGVVVYAPVDVMISQSPLQTRQPDVLFISFERLEQYGSDDMEELLYLANVVAFCGMWKPKQSFPFELAAGP